MRFGFGFVLLAETAVFAGLLWAVANERRFIRFENRLLRSLRKTRAAAARRKERENEKRLNKKAVYIPVKAEGTAAEEKAA